MIPKVTMRQALTAPALLGEVLGGDSRETWRVLLMATMGEPLTVEELVIFNRITGGRSQPPTAMVEELLGIIGRKGGKTSAIAALLIYLGELCDHRALCARRDRYGPAHRARSEAGDIAPRVAAGIIDGSPVLRHAVANKTADTVEFRSGIVIEVRSASFRRLRGMSCVAVLADEACFFTAMRAAPTPTPRSSTR